MQFDNIRVSRKLWGAFLGLMIAMLLMSAFAQNRGNSSMSAAMDRRRPHVSASELWSVVLPPKLTIIPVADPVRQSAEEW